MIHIKNHLNINKNIAFVVVLLLFCCVIFWGCVKNDKLYSPEEGTIYMPQAYQDKGKLDTLFVDSSLTVYFGSAYGGFNSPVKEISTTFEVDTTLIAKYNTNNIYSGKTYFAFPEGSYTISSFTSTIEPGSTSSTPLILTINTSNLSFGKYYILPVKLTSASSGNIDTSLAITYFISDTLKH